MSDVAELIHRRRRQVLIHSIAYYKCNVSMIDDALFDVWARELAQLQQDNPEISESVEYMLDGFRDFAGETGFHLPIQDKRANRVAQYLMAGGRSV